MSEWKKCTKSQKNIFKRPDKNCYYLIIIIQWKTCWPALVIIVFENKSLYVRRKVRIGTIPELSCAKWEFSLCPPIPELYRTILELRKGYMLKIYKVCVTAQSGNNRTKWEFVKRRDSSWNKTEKWVMRKRFECLIRKTDYSNNIATSFWAK